MSECDFPLTVIIDGCASVGFFFSKGLCVKMFKVVSPVIKHLSFAYHFLT